MYAVTKENQEQTPAPLNAIVKWSRWRRWTDEITGIEWLEYSIRMTPSLPQAHAELLAGCNLVGEKSSFFQVLSIKGESAAVSEGEVTVYPYETYRFRIRADEFFGKLH